MRLIEPLAVKRIDSYLINEKNIDERELIRRAGAAVADAVRRWADKGAKVCFLIGRGNNGADGCAAALALADEYEIALIDFSMGSRRSAGLEYYLDRLSERGMVPTSFSLDTLDGFSVIVDAIFGSGAHAPYPDYFPTLAAAMTASGAKLIAVDVPMSVDALSGAVMPYTPHFDETVMLTFMKCGVVSYPAREYAGRLTLDKIGADDVEPWQTGDLARYYMTKALAGELLPKRAENSSKGSFGRLMTVVGSERYLGAGLLSLEACLRCGAGYVISVGTDDANRAMMQKFPEVIYKSAPKTDALDDGDISELCDMSDGCAVTLVGCGSGCSSGLLRLVRALLSHSGGALVLDADAINALATLGEEGRELLKQAKRPVILTPHPLEFSRLSGIPLSEVQSDRMLCAERFAREYGALLVLKGAGTVTTDGRVTYINSSGSSALAKAGSGDVLAGALSSLVASGAKDALTLSALAVYFHASASDTLSLEYSTYGVTPSDLPKQIAREIANVER